MSRHTTSLTQSFLEVQTARKFGLCYLKRLTKNKVYNLDIHYLESNLTISCSISVKILSERMAGL